MMGEAIRIERLKRHWSQEELANKIKQLAGYESTLPLPKLARIERNQQEARVSDLQLICRVFGTSADELMALAEDLSKWEKA